MASRRPPRDPASTKPAAANKTSAAAPRSAASTLEPSVSLPQPFAAPVVPTATTATSKRPSRKQAGNKVQSATRGAANSGISADVRRAMIAEGAYLRAERRGFAGGHEDADWLAAEREVDELLGARVTNPAQ